MNIVLNSHNVHYLTNNHCGGQGQQRLAQFQQPVQSYVVPNFPYSNSASASVGHVGHLCLPNNNYNTMMPLSVPQQLQSELSKAYQMKQEQLRASQQRHMEEIHHMHSHPHIRHHCAIIDRLDKEDSRYADFTRQVKDNESQFEANNDTFDDKHYIAQKMNAQRLSALGNSGSLSHNSSTDSFIRSNNDCVDLVSDEETSTNVRNGYESSPSANSSVSNDALPLCDPGQSASLLVESESNVASRPVLTCLSLLEEWPRQGCNDEEEYETTIENGCKKEEEGDSFAVDYAWINSELEKMELAETEKKVREECLKKRIDSNVCAPVVSLPMPMQMPVSVNVPLNWTNPNYALPVVTMPVLHFPYQSYVAPNVVNAAMPETVNGTNVYVNEQFRYFA